MKYNFFIVFFGIIFVASSLMFSFSLSKSLPITGYAISGTTSANVSVSTYYSFTLSEGLGEGIQFGQVETIPSGVSATGNYNGTPTNSNRTIYSVDVSSDSNAEVVFCISGTHFQNSGGDIIGVSNESFTNSSSNNNISISSAELLDSIPIPHNSLPKEGGGIASPGNSIYFRFYLDIPAGTPPGTYNNTVFFEGIKSTGLDPWTECNLAPLPD